MATAYFRNDQYVGVIYLEVDDSEAALLEQFKEDFYESDMQGFLWRFGTIEHKPLFWERKVLNDRLNEGSRDND